MRPQHVIRRSASLALITAPWLLMAGCATQHAPAGPAGIPLPPLQLVTVGTLAVPGDCAFRSGRVYRTNYRVESDGHVADVAPDPAPACLQLALTDWVSGFRYAPPGEPVTTVIDWMGVSGRAPRHAARPTALGTP